MRLLHWTTVLLLVGLFTSGWSPGAHGISSLHLTLGVVLAPVVAARLAARWLIKAPSPLGTHAALIWASRANQLILYTGLLAAILTGLTAFSPHPFMPHAKLFGIIDLPAMLRPPADFRRTAALVHQLAVWALLLAAAVHVGAIIGHVLLADRSALRRMTWSQRDRTRRSPVSGN